MSAGCIETICSMRWALTDISFFGSQFSGASWQPWKAILLGICGEELNEAELVDFKKLTGRATGPTEPVSEFWGGGKSRCMAVLAAYLAGCKDYRSILAPRERGQVQIIAATTDQANLLFVQGIFEASETLRLLVENRSSDTIRLGSGIDIVVRPASYRSTRGASCIAIISDELAFWRIEGAAQPDTEILRALRPSLATTHGPLIAISSPYARRGELWKAYSKHYGKDGPILIAQSPTWIMNSTIDRAWIDQQFEKDPVAASAEYGANFRTDVEQFISLEAIEACVTTGIFERYPLSDTRYFAFVDPSGGSSDSMTLAISHAEDNIAVLDAIREVKPPFSPESVVAEFSALLTSYRISSVRGDRYGGEWPREQFRKVGIDYLPSDKSRSEIYSSLLPLLNSRRVDLLDDKHLIAQLVGLERRTARGGRDSINHSPGMHDDRINAAAGALVGSSYQPVEVQICGPVIIPGLGRHNPFGAVGPNPFSDIHADSDYSRVDGDARTTGFSIKY